MKERYVPEKGDLVWVDLNPVKGHEQRGDRPALVVSSKKYNDRSGMVLLCPITAKIKGYPFEVVFQGKHIGGAVLSDQLRSIDWIARKLQKIESVTNEVNEEVKAKISVLIS